MSIYLSDKYPLQEETRKIIGACIEVHKILGQGLSEVVYKDALEIEFKRREIDCEREKEYTIEYKGRVLPHNFFADFVILQKVILEVKAQRGIVLEYYNQVINYLAISGCKIGLLVNFGGSSIKVRRVIF